MARGANLKNKMEGVHIALLRGMNVGGKNRLAMADLRRIFVEAGCDSVGTYIQSGNVVFRSSRALAERIPAVVEKEIEKRFGLAVPVIVRSVGELRKLCASNPFLAEADPSKLHVVFLAEKPDESRVASLKSNRSAPDEFAVRGSEIFMHCPSGMARTKLNNAFWDSSLKTTSTIRNWRTVLELVRLADEKETNSENSE